MISLPVGGMITRSACGRITRRIVWARVRPSDAPASRWPGSTLMMPGADDLGHVGAFTQTEAEIGGRRRRDDRVGVDGEPFGAEERDAERDHWGTGRRGCTRRSAAPARESRGTRRCRTSAAPDSSLLSESRISAVDHAQRDADRHRRQRELDGEPDAGENLLAEEIFADDRPLEVRIGEDDRRRTRRAGDEAATTTAADASADRRQRESSTGARSARTRDRLSARAIVETMTSVTARSPGDARSGLSYHFS